MKCPYCAEEIKDQAIVCKHCTRDLIFVRPLLERLTDLDKRVARLENHRGDEALSGDADARSKSRLPAALSAAVRMADRIDQRVPLLSPFSALALTFIALVAAHFLIIVEYDLSLVYLRLVSILVPALFGFVYRGASGTNLLADFGAGLAVAVLSILTMSALVSKVDEVPLLPQDAQGWREYAEYGASITFAFFTGIVARHGLTAFRSASFESSRLIGYVSRYIAMKTRNADEEEEGSAMEERLKSMESIISSTVAIGSAVISVVTGLYQFFG